MSEERSCVSQGLNSCQASGSYNLNLESHQTHLVTECASQGLMKDPVLVRKFVWVGVRVGRDLIELVSLYSLNVLKLQ